MFNNVGKKLKGLAKVVFVIEAIASIVSGFVLMISSPVGLLVVAAGILLAWITSWFLYGFGELIDKVCDIERNTRSNNGKSEVQMKEELARRERLENLRQRGLISEEEFQIKINEEI